MKSDRVIYTINKGGGILKIICISMGAKMRRNVTLGFVSFRGPTYQNIVLSITRTNIDCDRDLGHGAPYRMFCMGTSFSPIQKAKVFWGHPLRLEKKETRLFEI